MYVYVEQNLSLVDGSGDDGGDFLQVLGEVEGLEFG